ncbi:beta strand repeat-containing protein [Spirosoma jeollabukense]
MKTRLLPAGFALRPAHSLYYTLLLMLVGISSVLAQAGTIRYVKAGGTGSGSSWASASGDLQAMINASAAGDQVWVAAGTYKPTTTTDRTINFSMRPDLAIYGGFVGNETSLGARPTINPITGNPSSTTLSGDIGTVGDNSDNSYHVIANFNFLTTTAILDGFVITGGNANLTSANHSTDSGGGMHNFTSFQGEHTNPLIRNCSFVANSALSSGGAVYNGAVGCASDCNPTLINCFFQGNSARQGGAMANDGSANDAFCSRRSSPALINCSFVANSARFGGAMYNSGFGGGGYGESSPTLTNCSFVTNSANDIGGAMYNVGTSKGRNYAKLTNCSFQGNTASYQGGAIANDGSDGVCDPKLTNCSFQGNAASYQGGAMFNTSVANTTTGECSPTLTNCVVFGNGGANTFYNVQVYPRVYYSLIETSVTGWQNDGNNLTTTVSPFAGTNTTQLRANSPAINAGDGSVDAGATDLAGNPRIVGCKIDMGAFEFQYTFLPIAINAQPASSSMVCAGTAVSVPVSVSGTVSGYQWYKDSFANPVAGQTSATLTLNNPQPGNAGSYSLVVTSTCNSLTSTAFNLTVNKSTVSISPSSATVCQGQSVTLTASGASSYTWNTTTTGNTLTATTTGTYSVTGVDGNGCSNTATAQVTVYRPAVSISPGSVSICEGQSALLTASGASSYTWNDNTTGNTLTATTTGTYSVTGVDGRGCSNTATASVTVNNVPTVSISASPSATIIQGSSVTLTAVATGATAFAWVTGSTSSSIVVSPTTSTPYSVTARSAAGCTASASLTITVIPPTCSPILYVTQQGAGLRDGSSWSNALGASQLQIAINTAANCGGNRQVWVATGTYKPTTGSDRNASFSMRNGVAIYGGFAGTEAALTDRPAINPVTGQPSSTTLSGDIGSLGNTSDNSFRVISNPASLSLTTTAVLDGFVITGGAGGTLGGGMFNDASSPALRNCSFVNNSVVVTSGSTSRGGAMYNGNGSSPQLTNCSFQGNSISGSNGNISYGGAMSNFTNSSPLLINCSFVNNSVSGSTNTYGGAMANNVNSNPQLINCSFISNSAVGGTTTRGGAINNGNNCTPQLINCSFLSNSVSGGTTTNQGGAIANNTSSTQLTDCVVWDNGGGNTFYNVSSPTSVSITASYSLFDDTVTGYTTDPTNLTASSSPFASTTSTQLATGSPAINTGSNQAYQSAGGPATDLAGHVRIQNGTIDMGAYETTFTAPTSDLTLLLFAQPALVYGPTLVSVVVTVYELNGVVTSGPVSVKLSEDTMLGLGFDPAATSVGGKPVQNPSWQFSGPVDGMYTLTSTQPLPAGGRLSVGLSGPLTPGATKGRLSVSATVVDPSGSETRLNNNTDAETIEYFNK